MSTFYILFVTVIASVAAIPISERVWTFGECYDIRTPADFDLKKFTTGSWYEISRVPIDFEKNAECVKMSFLLDGEELDIVLEATFKNGTDGAIGAVATIEKNENETNLQATFPGDNSTMKLAVLATDFDNFSILYSCKQLSMNVIPEKEERIWVLGRKTYFEDDIQKKVNEALVVDGDYIGLYLDDTNQICNHEC